MENAWMNITDMIESYHGDRSSEIRGIFASIHILQNRLNTIFDKTDEILSLKQYMLFVMVQQSTEATTFTHLGKLLGSSRQNIKKLATSLETKGFVTITHEAGNKRNASIKLTPKAHQYSDQVFKVHDEKIKSLFKDYSDEEIHLFYDLITKLYAGVEREE